jgi:hypothetical protein
MSKAQAVSMNPDNFIDGGLKSDFDGVVLDAVFTPWDYNGNLDHHILAAALTIQPDDEETPFVQHYSAGDLDAFLPGNGEGEDLTPVDLSVASPATGASAEEVAAYFASVSGPVCVRVGKKEGLSNSSNWAQFIGAALQAKFPKERLNVDIRKMFVGTYAHFDRIPQKKRSGLIQQPKADGRARNNDILCITEFKGFKEVGAKGVAGKPVAKASAASGSANAPSTASTTASAGGSSDLDTAISALVIPAVKAAGEAGLGKTALPKLALKLGPAHKAKGVKRIVETEYLESLAEHNVLYDGDTGVLTYFEAE